MLIFVYGTLKRGGSNHGYMRGQNFIGEAATAPHYRLYDLGGYPGMVSDPVQGLSIQGEVWDVNEKGINHLDELEDTEGGEYAREIVSMLPPFDQSQVQGYRYLRSVHGCPDKGTTW